MRTGVCIWYVFTYKLHLNSFVIKKTYFVLCENWNNVNIYLIRTTTKTTSAAVLGVETATACNQIYWKLCLCRNRGGHFSPATKQYFVKICIVYFIISNPYIYTYISHRTQDLCWQAVGMKYNVVTWYYTTTADHFEETFVNYYHVSCWSFTVRIENPWRCILFFRSHIILKLK